MFMKAKGKTSKKQTTTRKHAYEKPPTIVSQEKHLVESIDSLDPPKICLRGKNKRFLALCSMENSNYYEVTPPALMCWQAGF